VNYEHFAHLYDESLDVPGYPLDRDIPEAEYHERVRRARESMREAGLDALVVTSSTIGQWFTGPLEPHEWHDLCPSRVAMYVLTATDDVLYMTPTAGGEHFNTTRRSSWVSSIRAIVERTAPPRVEIWDLEQVPQIFDELGISSGRLGFELGDCMTLGLSIQDFMRLPELLPKAAILDGSPVFRRLMSVHTPLEIERVRRGCEAGVWIHEQVPRLLRPGMTERVLLEALADAFGQRYDRQYTYAPGGGWDVRNPARADPNSYHTEITERRYERGDYVFRGWSGVHFRGYLADVDRACYVGLPTPEVQDLYRIAWECNQAMAQAIRPGSRCCDVYAACARVEAQAGLGERQTGRVGHGLRNVGGLSVHPANETVLEPGMILSVEPMFPTIHGFFDLEDQYVVTEAGAEILHAPAPAELPRVDA
jgi:Xaa-Pro dipeptidase